MAYASEQVLADIPFDDYRAHDGINATGLKQIARSPAHYRACLEEEPRESPALEFGKRVHAAVLEPERFLRHAVVRPAWDARTKAGKAAKAEFEAALDPQAMVVTEAEYETLRRMVDVVHAHPHAAPLLQSGIREGVVYWQDPEWLVGCKARLDFVSSTGLVVDLKTTEDARPDAFRRAVWNYRYDIQAAHYLAAASELGFAAADTYIWLVIEKSPPYEIGMYTAGLSVLGLGHQWRAHTMQAYVTCVQSGFWPGYQAQIEALEMPVWAQGVEYGF